MNCASFDGVADCDPCSSFSPLTGFVFFSLGALRNVAGFFWGKIVIILLLAKITTSTGSDSFSLGFSFFPSLRFRVPFS